MKHSAWILVSLSALLLSACGFHLRGDADLPAAYRQMRVEGPLVIRDELRLQVGEGADSGPVLKISGERFDRRVLSVDPDSGRVREVELAYAATFQVRDTRGGTLLEPQEVRMIRDYVFDETAVVGNSREESVLRQEMQREAAQQIVRRLRASLGR